MDRTFILEILESRFLPKRDGEKAEKRLLALEQEVQEKENRFRALLNDEQKKLFDCFKLDLIDYIGEQDYAVKSKILFLGMRVGMEYQEEIENLEKRL